MLSSSSARSTTSRTTSSHLLAAGGGADEPADEVRAHAGYRVRARVHGEQRHRRMALHGQQRAATALPLTLTPLVIPGNTSPPGMTSQLDISRHTVYTET